MNGAHTPGPWVKRSAILTGADGSYVVAAGLGLGLGSDNGDGKGRVWLLPAKP